MELLVVIAIIAMLVTMLAPTLGRARDLARKAACQGTLSTHGKAVGMYLGAYGTYPLYGAQGTYVDGWPDYGNAWAKLYGIMEISRIPGTKKNNWGNQAYLGERDEIWHGALCPGMDADAIWDWLEQCALIGYPNPGKGLNHRAAISWQWNSCLRGPTPNAPFQHCAAGRWSPRLEACRWGDPHYNIGITRWIDYVMYPPGSQSTDMWYAAQAVRPGEIDNPAIVAEAWDSCDLETAPNVNLAWPVWEMENLQAGWHVGPHNRGTKGWALLNRLRHPGGPNILYADGHVAADARRVITPADLGPCPSGSWEGLQTVSWDDYSPEWGTLHHILPKCEYYKENAGDGN